MNRRGLTTSAAVVSVLVGIGRADVNWNGLYHNNTNLDLRGESVPMADTPGLGPHFLELDRINTNVTVRFLTDHPACRGPVACRVRFYSDKVEYQDAHWVANVVLSRLLAFHGTPAGGAVTVEVWRATWCPPPSCSGTVYCAPQVIEKDEKERTGGTGPCPSPGPTTARRPSRSRATWAGPWRRGRSKSPPSGMA